MAYEGLDREGRLVMQALAVFDRPVPQAALSWVLEPYLGEADVGAAALRLWRGRFVNIDRATEDIDLHRIDREYSYAQVPRDSSAEPNLRELERRAAGYYQRLRLGQEEWRSLGALEPQFREFEHLVRAEEHDAAAALLSDIDARYLIYHGHARLVRDMRLRLEGRIRDLRLRMLHEHALGQCFLTIGPFQGAVSRFKRALPLATELHDRQAEAAISERLGTTYRLMGALPEAETRLTHALEISRELGSAATESTSAFSLGLALAYRGKFTAAIARAREALERGGRGPGGSLDRQRAHNVLSLAYIALGDAPQALAHARKAIEENEQARKLHGDSVWGSPDLLDATPYIRNVLGMAQLQLGREQEAAAEFERTITEARAVEQPRPEGFALFNLARIRRRHGKMRRSLELAELSASTLEKLSETAAATASALAAAIRASLAQDARSQAQRLLDCAEIAKDVPDLYDPLELVDESEVLAAEGGWSDLADRARHLRRTLKKRHAAA
jgi:tetratricopeptide (TPR) repeat protein